jgi:hypothetical protein
MSLNELMELNQLARRQGEDYPFRRGLYHQLIHAEDRTFWGVIGPRGSGKTVLLKQLLSSWEHSFYISADSVPFLDLFSIAKQLKGVLGIQKLLVDEAHFLSGFAQQLKKIYDFLGLQVIFTSSVALAMEQSAVDLTRRVRLMRMPLFSFREFIELQMGETLPIVSLNQILQGEVPFEILRFEHLFEIYLRGGILPYFQETKEPLPLLENTLHKIIRNDVPTTAPIKVRELPLLDKVMRFVGRASVDGVNYTTIAKNVGITKYKAASYLELLSKALVLHTLLPSGANVMREPKVLMCPPYRLLYRDYEDAIGGLREDFCVEMLFSAGERCTYLKSTRGSKTPDFLLQTKKGKSVIEVGGKGKGRSQFKGIEVESKVIFGQGVSFKKNRRPLSLLGFLY